MMNRDTVVGIFDDRDDAQRAIEALKNAGFRTDDIGITMRDRHEAEALVEDTGASAGAGAATGALAGGALGGLAGWLVGIGALAIPGIGPILAAGPLAAALTGAAIGAAGGGLLGALTGMGVPEEEARWYESEVNRGGILVTARAEGRYEEARRIMLQHGAREAGAEGTVDTTGTSRAATMDRDYDKDTGKETATGAVSGGAAGAVAGGVIGGPVGAAAGAAIGGVAGAAAGKGVGEARPADEHDKADEGMVGGGTTGGALGAVAGAVVGGPPGAVAGAVIGGAAGAATGAGAGATQREEWDDVSPEFRSSWQNRYGTSGRRWEQDEPVYRYGFTSAYEPRYQNREWDDVETDMRNDWTTRFGRHGSWDEVRGNAREAWDRARMGLRGSTGMPTEARGMKEDHETIRLREEQLRATTRPVQTGEVEVRKEVVSEQRTIDVPVTREEVVIERRPVDRRTADRIDAGDIREGESIRVPVREEQVNVEKRPVVTEEVEIGKRSVTETERVSDTVRREELRVDREGDAKMPRE